MGRSSRQPSSIKTQRRSNNKTSYIGTTNSSYIENSSYYTLDRTSPIPKQNNGGSSKHSTLTLDTGYSARVQNDTSNTSLGGRSQGGAGNFIFLGQNNNHYLNGTPNQSLPYDQTNYFMKTNNYGSASIKYSDRHNRGSSLEYCIIYTIYILYIYIYIYIYSRLKKWEQGYFTTYTT